MPAFEHLPDGLITEGSRGIYTVTLEGESLRCTIRGRLRKELVYGQGTSTRRNVRDVRVREKDPVAVGDRVRVSRVAPGQGVIEEVLARTTGAITRGDPDPGHEALTSVAGIDQVVIVFAARNPAPHLRMLDRFLVMTESQRLPALICLNKADLGVPDYIEEQLEVYRRIGYQVLQVSATRADGLDALKAATAHQVSAFVGPSGVGKSSLLNLLAPDLGQRVSEVSAASHKGRHTTTGARLFPLAGGGYVADTAGIRALALGAGSVERLDMCFREFAPYLGTCRYDDCVHLDEPGCAVRDAARGGAIDQGRYESYRKLKRDGLSDA
ncbi:MAG TPA: ribosome small subunit-dependent GTPase A [Ktedonobacterales bacterium]